MIIPNAFNLFESNADYDEIQKGAKDMKVRYKKNYRPEI